MKKILISLILASSISHSYAETKVTSKIELTQESAAKKIIGTWKVSDISKIPGDNEEMKKSMAEAEFTFTGSEFNLKMMGQEVKSTYVVKDLKDNLLTISITNGSAKKDEKIRITKDGIILEENDGSGVPMKKI